MNWSAGLSISASLLLPIALPAQAQGSAVDLETSISIAGIELPAPWPALGDVRFHCDRIDPAAMPLPCAAGTLGIETSPFGRLQLDFTAEPGAPSGVLRFRGVGAAATSIDGSLRPGNPWQLDLQVGGLDLGLLWRGIPAELRFEQFQFAGTARLEASLEGTGGELRQVEMSVQVGKLDYADGAGLQVGEGLDFSGRLKGRRDRKDAWRGELDLSWKGGALYADPFYLEAQSQPTTLLLRGGVAEAEVRLEELRLVVPDGIRASAGGTLRRSDSGLDPVNLAFSFASDALSKTYSRLLQPLLIGTAADDLELSGRVRGSGELRSDGLHALRLELEDVSVQDRAERFGLQGLHADLDWRKAGIAELSHISFSGGHLYRIPFGAARAVAGVEDGDLRLTQAMQLPLLEGVLDLRQLRYAAQGEQPGWRVSADLQGVDLGRFSQSLDWPELSGRLEGHIPELSYHEGNIRTSGALQVEVFDGTIEISGLQLRDILGAAPVLEAEVSFRELDLEALTRTFSFGRIQGKLEGDVRQLQLVRWQPSRFTLELRTPSDYRGPTRISQRAVDNLTALGNGASGALSGTVLGLFKEFGYSAISLQVRLEGAKAELDGVAAPQGGYYIVRGSGLPRIDVIGRNRRVAWKELMARLRDIRFEGAVIQ